MCHCVLCLTRKMFILPFVSVWCVRARAPDTRIPFICHFGLLSLFIFLFALRREL